MINNLNQKCQFVLYHCLVVLFDSPDYLQEDDIQKYNHTIDIKITLK